MPALLTDRKQSALRYHHCVEMRGKRSAVMLLALIFMAGPCLSDAQPVKKPNIIFILADDLGYGDLSCYGQRRFRTPHLDKLAQEGMRFTNHYSGSPVCAPSRSSLMTGLHSGHTYVRGNKEVRPEGQWPLPDKAHTLMEILKTSGYVTGVFGKWGLGPPGSEGAPENQGVDEFFGFNCQRLAHNYFPEHLWHNQTKIPLDGNTGSSKGDYAPDLIYEKAIQFLEGNRENSFFMFYPITIPHAELVAPEKYMALYRGKFLPEKNFAGVDDGENFRQGPYGSQPEAHAAFAAMIHLLDEQVGGIMEKVSALGLDENTLILFSSDNGPHLEAGADPDYFDSNGVLRGYKRDLYEGGMRVPMIARWPGKIKAGEISDHVSAFWDVMPTLAELVQVDLTQKTDGISYLPTLLGQRGKQRKHDHLYWEFHEQGGRLALRRGDWKLLQYDVGKNPPGAFELYNLKDDPSEKNNQAEKYPHRVEELKKIMLSARVPNKDFPFPLDER